MQVIDSAAPARRPRLQPAEHRRNARVVVKLGTRTLTGGGADLLRSRLVAVAEVVCGLEGVDVVLVSSGAVAAGFRLLGHLTPPTRLEDRQAAAAVGQSRLMRLWSDVFEARGRQVGQILLTNDCLTDRPRYVAARRTLSALLEAGVIPVVNENDTVSVSEIMVGDNDNLAAVTAALADADLLVLLTDVPAVFTAPPGTPGAEPIAFASSVEELRPYCFAKTAAESRGGMQTKLEAAEKAGRYGVGTVIAAGDDPGVLRALLEGDPVGTYIAPAEAPLRARRHWMAVQRPAGAIRVDEGAVQALRRRASLLPSGVKAVEGRFRRGDLVAVLGPDGTECARGIVRFDDREVERIRGLHTRDVARVLGQDEREGAAVVMRPDRIFVPDPPTPASPTGERTDP